MKNKIFFIIILSAIILFSYSALAANSDFNFFGPIVPQCGVKNVCTVCDIFALIQRLINFSLSVVVLVGIVMVTYGGFLMILPGLGGSSASLLEKGKKIVTRSLVGIVIVLFAWLAIDTVIKIIVGQGTSGGAAVIKATGFPWNKIECTATEFPTDTSGGTKGPGKGGEELVNGYPKSIADMQRAQPPEGSALRTPSGTDKCATNLAQWDSAINAAAAKYGVSPARIKAIISIESGGKPEATGTAGDYGLMQMTLPTAKTIDPSATVEKLKNPEYNIDIGTHFYGNRLRADGLNQDLATAEYNGGPAANDPSVNCNGKSTGVKRWQCEWDVNGCYPNPTGSQCTANNKNKGYAVTRYYVPTADTLEQKFANGTCT